MTIIAFYIDADLRLTLSLESLLSLEIIKPLWFGPWQSAYQKDTVACKSKAFFIFIQAYKTIFAEPLI